MIVSDISGIILVIVLLPIVILSRVDGLFQLNHPFSDERRCSPCPA